MAPGQGQRPSAQEGAQRLLEFLIDAAHNVVLEDDQQGRFGVLYDPPSMLESLVQVATTEENVGVPSLPPPVAVHSLQYNNTPYLDVLSEPRSLKEWHQVPVQIQSSCDETIRIRWVDMDYGIRSSHTWNLPPRSTSSTDNNHSLPTWLQHCSPGHLFLLSIVKNDNPTTIHNHDEEPDLFSAYDGGVSVSAAASNETILGAYRPLRPLPSGKYHTLTIRELKPHENVDGGYRQFIVEFALSDPYDALCVATASLDPHTGGSGTVSSTATIKLLSTIVSNLVQHPGEAKYEKLRVSNPKIQSHVMSSWGTVQVLTLCGFERTRLPAEKSKSTNSTDSDKEDANPPETDDFLVIPPPAEMAAEERAELLEMQSQAMQLLKILLERSVPGFCADLAPPTPWEPPRAITGSGGGRNQRWAETQDYRRGFISAEERWARAERVNRNRRNGRGRRPDPGNAPSSRGNWGR
ncbi:PUB domain containing protein [Nitzschia inconspicua]|uniref:PUB domain containing protein n=1 Tax=Nitzschia inconspicua TaxID=303405 RepID=A0A9K3KI55_9STRA|nr:PUB domain containing protein [Nitzschia inconspicua]